MAFIFYETEGIEGYLVNVKVRVSKPVSILGVVGLEKDGTPYDFKEELDNAEAYSNMESEVLKYVEDNNVSENSVVKLVMDFKNKVHILGSESMTLGIVD